MGAQAVVVYKTEPVADESHLIKQRIRNLIELAIIIGRKEGLIKSNEETKIKEEGHHVADQGSNRGHQVAQAGQDQVRAEEGI